MFHKNSQRIRTTWVTLCAMAIALCFGGCGDDASTTNIGTEDKPVRELNFGFVSTESTAGLKTGFDPFLEEMSKQLGVPVRAYFAPDYAGIIEGMRFGKIDVAWFGNKSAMEAVDRANGEIFAHTTQKDGTAGYWSVIIVQADSDLENIDDVIERKADLNFGNGDPHSTSGYLIPMHYLWAPRGVDPEVEFKRMVNANHETNLLAVANGQVDVATNNTMNLAKFRTNNPDMADKVRVIWKSPKIPPDPIVYRGDLPQDVKTNIREFILRYGKEGENAEEARALLANMSTGWGPFEPSNNDQLIPIREISIAKKIMEIKNNDSLEEAEKAEQIAPLQQQLDALKQQSSAS